MLIAKIKKEHFELSTALVLDWEKVAGSVIYF